jgi:phosphoglucosamine mutase
MSGPLFGTDGIRGAAYEPPLDRLTVARLGAALAAHLAAENRPRRLLLAGDPRASTADLAAWLGGAFVAAGGEVVWAGVLPTPAVSHLLRDRPGFGCGAVVSASHNPAHDNGIKLVDVDGSKWAVEQERSLEARLRAWAAEPPVAPLPPVTAGLAERYLELLERTLPARPLAGLDLLIDAANGAASEVAPRLFTQLGATVATIHASPDGANINDGCGALHPQGLAERVVARGHGAGVAFDGDADRAVLVGASGRVLDGDDVLLLWGRSLAAAGRLPGRRLVATVMSNLGLELALEREGIATVRCPVGDREVWETMQREGAALGGEQSGHVICAHWASTGDGLLTAAHVLAAAQDSGRPLEALAEWPRFPQVLINVRVQRRTALEELPALSSAVRDLEGRLGRNGRVFVRYSGTEPLLRILVEAASADVARQAADHLAALARQHLGAA